MEGYTVLKICIMDREDGGYYQIHKVVCTKESENYVKSAIYGFISKDIQDMIKVKEYHKTDTNSLVINPSDLCEAIQLVAIHYARLMLNINRMNDYYKYKEK